jgi:hypothetical protein
MDTKDSSSLWHPAQSIESALGVLARMPTGTALLKRFYPYYLAQKIKIQAYPEEIAKALSQTRSHEEFPGAACVTESDQAIIYYDRSTPLGVLAILLAHEITHALDIEIWRQAKESRMNPACIQESEKMAVQVQKLVTQEMLYFYPDFVLKLIRNFRHSKIVFPADVA